MKRLPLVLIAAIFASSLPLAAEARINGPRITSIDFACGAIQDEIDQLRAEYASLSPYDSRREEILTRLRNLGSDWNSAGCRAVFGSPVARTNVASTGVTGGPNAGVSQPRLSRPAASVNGTTIAAPH